LKYDIALIRSNYDSHIISPHLGLGYLSSFLKSKNYNALIIDGLKHKLNNQQIYEILQKENICIVGITCLSAEFYEVAVLSRFLKAKWGGGVK
jgi:hypothetical protein